MTPEHAEPLPLSHPVRVEDIKMRGTHVAVRAQASDLPGIAKHLGLASVEALEARYVLSRSGERVKLEGTITAKLHQTCVITLEAFPTELEAPVRLDFAPEEEARASVRRAEIEDEQGRIDIEVKLNEADPPEPIVDGVIDLGAVTLEFLALGLDPYPRKPGVNFDAGPAGSAVESPFAALAKLKRSE